MSSPTTGMKGHGYYDDHSEYQRRVAERGLDALVSLVQRTEGRRADLLTIVDYGCSEGANSIAAVRAVITAIRRERADSCLVAVHNDLPTNDFNALFHNLSDPDRSYLSVPGGPILPMGSPRSFYDLVVPPSSATIGVSFSAAHWFRSQPAATVPRSMCAMDDTRTPSPLAEQADADWTQFLTARASELTAGGVLYVQMIGTLVDPDGTRHVTAERLLHAMHDVAEAQVAQGQLREETLAGFVFPTYMRSAAEAVAPLQRGGSSVAGRFEVEQATVDPVPNPYLDTLHDGDAATYAQRYVAFVRAFTESTLRRDLFEPGADHPDTALDDFYAELERRTAADPAWSVFEDWTLTVALTRTASP